MSFKDFLKNNGAKNSSTEMRPVPTASGTERIDKEPAISAGVEQPDRLQEMQEKLSALLVEGQKQAKSGDESKNLLVEILQKWNEITEISKLQREQNEKIEKIQQIEKRLAATDGRDEQTRKAIIGLLVLAYVTFCTCASIAQQLFNISGFYGIWSFFKIFTGLKLLL